METDDEPYEPKSPEYEKDSNDEGSNDEGSGDISDNEHMETDEGEPYEPKSPLGAPPKSPEDEEDSDEESDNDEDSFMGLKKPDGTNAEAFKIGATMGDIGKWVCVQFKGYNCPPGIKAGWHQGKVACLVKQHAEYNEATRTYTSLTIPDQGYTDYAAIIFGPEITIVKHIHIFALETNFHKMSADIGLVGLAVMGENLVLNIESKGYTCAVFNRTTSKVDDFVNGRGKGKNFIGTHSLEDLCKNLKKPRKVMLMVKAGEVVDQVSTLPY
ncbi:hypothetical protein T484DRAFT_1899935 [Baffinella frigidus]|nr:hypothetical protein T484DRAFT_1899935 [Cryptophyta sp. CCMP2293]